MIRMRGQASKDILQMGMWVESIHLRGLDQAHHGRRTSARPLGPREQQVLAPKGNGPNLVLDPVVIDR